MGWADGMGGRVEVSAPRPLLATPLAGHAPRWPSRRCGSKDFSTPLGTLPMSTRPHQASLPQEQAPLESCVPTALPTSRLLSRAPASRHPAFGSPVWFLRGHPVSLVEPLMMTPKEVGSLPAYWVPLPVGHPCHPGTDVAPVVMCVSHGRVFTVALPSGSPQTTEGAKTPECRTADSPKTQGRWAGSVRFFLGRRWFDQGSLSRLGRLWVQAECGLICPHP